MPDELSCQYCGAPLDQDEEFEHRTCIACMYGSDYRDSEQLRELFSDDVIPVDDSN